MTMHVPPRPVVRNPVFSDRPDVAFVSDWRDHIERTGYPEAFTGVSTEKPAHKDSIVLLSEEIRVPVSLRAGGERVPCPLCCPSSPKFMIGRMAWFPSDKTVAFIGHDCASRHFGDDYKEADRRFRREAQTYAYIRKWEQLVQRIDALIEFHAQASTVAVDADFMRQKLDSDAPGFAAHIRSEMAQTAGELSITRDLGIKDKGGRVVPQVVNLGKAAGLAFLSNGFAPMRVVKRLAQLIDDLREPLPEWEADAENEDAMNEILARGRRAENVLRDSVAMLQGLADTQQFLDVQNLRRIERWGEHDSTAFETFELRRDERALLVRVTSYAGRFFANVLVPATAFNELPTADHPAVRALTE